MKNLLYLLLICSSFCYGQNKMFVVSGNKIAVQFDTTTKTFTPQSTGNFNKYTVQVTSSSAGLMDCYDGNVFVFSDTLVSGDVAQIGTSGVYRITLHNALVNTTKRNIVMGGVVYVYDNATQELNIPINFYPMTITSRATGKVSATIYQNGIVYLDVIPAGVTTFGSGISKVVIP